MSSSILGLIIGGLVPAIFFGLSGVFAKSSTNAGIGVPFYLMIISAAVFTVGAGFYLGTSDATLTAKGGVHAFLSGAVWAIAAGCVALALNKFGIPISKLVPIYNMNTLVAVLLGLWIFSEWESVSTTPLIIGSLLIIVGGILVTNA